MGEDVFGPFSFATTYLLCSASVSSLQKIKRRKEIWMDFSNLKEIIDFAIAKEIEAAEFYEAVSREETMSGVRDMLLEFAAEERKHQGLLESFLEGGIDKSIQDYDLKWITDIKRSNYVTDMVYEKGMGYSDILMLAAKREEAALALYNEMLDQAKSEDGRKLFKVLCQEEAKHKLFLETKYDDYMAEMGD